MLIFSGKPVPEYFFWTGDAIYPKGQSLQDLEVAYRNLTDNPYYQQFLQQVQTVDGTWDDHDMGINDGGKLVFDKQQRAFLFMNFLSFGKTLTRKPSKVLSRISEREGIYHSRSVKNRNGGGGSAKFLFLDTRYQRDHHYIRSFGNLNLPFSALFAAATRTLYTLLGFGRNYNADILGEKQWSWLESELQTSSLVSSSSGDKNSASSQVGSVYNHNYHIIVSSIQVFTSNPAVESWGHFPNAKKRLLSMLKRYNPPGLVFLTGDVHHAETITIAAKNERGVAEEPAWVEVTSSGLTHSADDGMINGVLAPIMLTVFGGHRREAFDDGVKLGKNFGLISFDADVMNISVRGIRDGEVLLQRSIKPLSRAMPMGQEEVGIFPRIPTAFSSLLLLFVVLISAALWLRPRKTKMS